MFGNGIEYIIVEDLLALLENFRIKFYVCKKNVCKTNKNISSNSLYFSALYINVHQNGFKIYF